MHPTNVTTTCMRTRYTTEATKRAKRFLLHAVSFLPLFSFRALQTQLPGLGTDLSTVLHIESVINSINGEHITFIVMWNDQTVAHVRHTCGRLNTHTYARPWVYQQSCIARVVVTAVATEPVAETAAVAVVVRATVVSAPRSCLS